MHMLCRPSLVCALLWHYTLLSSRHSAQVLCLQARYVPQAAQGLHAREASSDLSATQEIDYQVKIAQKTFSQSMQQPHPAQSQEGPVRDDLSNGICMVMPLASVNKNTHGKDNQTYGALARSVLDTWGHVSDPDSFHLVFPSHQDFVDFQNGYGGLDNSSELFSDPRLLVINSSTQASVTRGEPTFPQNPSPLRLFEALQKRSFGMMFNDSKCMWYMSVDGDGYANPDALRKQLARLDHTLPYYLGSLVSRGKYWNKSLYGEFFVHGATGHLVSRALLESVDWGACVQELQNRKAAYGIGDHDQQVIGMDDVETSACVSRHLPEAKLKFMDQNRLLWSVEKGENVQARSLVDRMDPRWMEIAAAHRMSATLNYDAAKLSTKLSGAAGSE